MTKIIRIHGFSTGENSCIVVEDGSGTQLGKREASHLGVALEKVVKDFGKAYGVKKILTLAEVQHPGTINTLSRLICGGMSFRYWREGRENLSLLYISKRGLGMDTMLESLLAEVAPHLMISGVCSGESETLEYKVKREADRSLRVLSRPRGVRKEPEVSYAGVGETFRATVEGAAKIIPCKR